MRRAVFAGLFALFCAVIWANSHKFSSDIFAILGLDLTAEQRQILALSNDKSINILLTKPKQKELVLNLAAQNGVEIYENELNLKPILSNILAFASDEKAALLARDKAAFLDAVIAANFMPAGVAGDFLNLVDFRRLNFGYEVQNGLIKTPNFWLWRAEISGDFRAVLGFANALNEAGIKAAGAPFYAAFAADQAWQESSVLGGISLLLCVGVILAIFRRVRALWVAAVVGFALAGGLSSALLVLPSVHLLTVVVCTSLVGLILDYPMHILSSRGKPVARTLLAAFAVTAAGYALFLASPMGFLRQIAVFSLFALFCALLFSHFCFRGLAGVEFFEFRLKTPRFGGRFWGVFGGILAVILACGVWRFELKNERISDYANAPKWLMDAGRVVGEEFGGGLGGQFFLVRSAADFARQNGLKGAIFWAKFINDSEKIQAIKKDLSEILSDEKLLARGEKYGIAADLMRTQIAAVVASSTQTPRGLCEAVLAEGCGRFYAGELEAVYIGADGDLVGASGGLKDALNLKNGAQFLDIAAAISAKFDEIKINAILLKTLGLVLAAAFLWWFVGGMRAVCAMAVVLGSLAVTLSLVGGAGIFTVFGLILSSAVAVEYAIFALSPLGFGERVVGIVGAAASSAASFGLLVFSGAPAVADFGAAVGVGVVVSAIFAVILAAKNIPNNKGITDEA